MGLLGYDDQDVTQGLLSFGQLASQKRPFLGLLAGLAAADRSQAGRQELLRQRDVEERKLRLDEEMKRMQIDALRQQQAQQAAAQQKQQGIEDAYRNAFRSPQQVAMQLNGGPTVAAANAAPNFQPMMDQKALIDNLMKIDPVGAAQMLKPKDRKFEKVGETLVDVTDGVKPVFTAPQKPEAAPSAVREYEYAKAQGYPGTFQQFQLEQRRAGATNIGMPKIEVKMGEGIASQVGPMMKDSRAQAESGLRLVDSATRVLDAAEKNNLYAGPLANARLKIAQVGDILGIAGNDTQEKITNTRNVIRGMAEQAVSARAQLGGQAQISNSEQELLNKATSGDISELTGSEIVQIARLNDRLGRLMYGNYERQMGVMRNRPELQGVADFYAVPPMPAPRQQKRGGIPSPEDIDAELARRGSRTGVVGSF